MNRLLQGFITIERSMQIATWIGVVVFLGYLGVMNVKSTPISSPSPTVQK